MNCYQPGKKIDTIYQYQFYDEQRPATTYTDTYQYQQNYDNLNLNTDLHLDVESFVANLPSLEELDSIEQPNHYVYNQQPVEQQSNYQFYENPTSRVDVLNQVIYTTTATAPTSSSSNLSTNYSFSSNSNSSLEQNFQYIDSQSPKKKNLKCKIKRKDEKICCNVCGYKSSGFHYGSHTCEACKLFFRRAEKQIRKTGFNECKTKNCVINYENRANCSECRYKKCIAVGMGMSRSRFGRHTNQLGSNYTPNISEGLCNLIKSLKQTCLNSNVDLNILNNLIVEFYEKIIKLLSNQPNEHEVNSLEFSLQVDSPLSELSYLITQTKSNQTKLPDSVLILFCVLFDIKINSNDLKLQTIVSEFEICLKMIEESILKTNKFVLTLKIGLYFKILRHLLTQNNLNVLKDDPYDKRITDLMRSEFAMFKFDAENETIYQATSLSPCSSLSSSSTSSSTCLDTPILASLFLEVNQMLFKHMSYAEFNRFMTQTIEFE